MEHTPSQTEQDLGPVPMDATTNQLRADGWTVRDGISYGCGCSVFGLCTGHAERRAVEHYHPETIPPEEPDTAAADADAATRRLEVVLDHLRERMDAVARQLLTEGTHARSLQLAGDYLGAAGSSHRAHVHRQVLVELERALSVVPQP